MSDSSLDSGLDSAGMTHEDQPLDFSFKPSPPMSSLSVTSKEASPPSSMNEEMTEEHDVRSPSPPLNLKKDPASSPSSLPLSQQQLESHASALLLNSSSTSCPKTMSTKVVSSSTKNSSSSNPLSLPLSLPLPEDMMKDESYWERLLLMTSPNTLNNSLAMINVSMNGSTAGSMTPLATTTSSGLHHSLQLTPGSLLKSTSNGRASSSSSSGGDVAGNGSTPNSLSSSTRKRGRPLPEDLKDDAYWERRRKNNEAAKRSRDARRQKEMEIALRAALLEQENLKLRVEVASLKTELAKLRCIIFHQNKKHNSP